MTQVSRATNLSPNVHKAPGFNSRSNNHDVLQPLVRSRPRSHLLTDTYQHNLTKIGCSKSPLVEYKLNNTFINSRPCNDSDELNEEMHKLKIKKDKEQHLLNERKKKKAERTEAEKIRKELEAQLADEEAKEKETSEKKLETQRDQLKKAIELEKQKQQNYTEYIKLKDKRSKEKISKCASVEGLEEAKRYSATIENYQKNIRPLLQDKDTKKNLFELRKLLRRLVTQINVKEEIMFEKYADFVRLFESMKTETWRHIFFNTFAKLLLTGAIKAIDTDKDTLITRTFGTFTYLVMSKCPGFIDYFFGRMWKRCPYLIPQFHDDNATMTLDPIKARIGYKNKEEGIFRNRVEHGEEKACYIQFYAAICIAKPKNDQWPKNPIPIGNAWCWLAKINNMAPRDISLMFIVSFLDIAADRLMSEYGRQFRKLLLLLKETVGRYDMAVISNGPASRLTGLVEKYCGK